jgi:hypothetical protein
MRSVHERGSNQSGEVLGGQTDGIQGETVAFPGEVGRLVDSNGARKPEGLPSTGSVSFCGDHIGGSTALPPEPPRTKAGFWPGATSSAGEARPEISKAEAPAVSRPRLSRACRLILKLSRENRKGAAAGAKK